MAEFPFKSDGAAKETIHVNNYIRSRRTLVVYANSAVDRSGWDDGRVGHDCALRIV